MFPMLRLFPGSRRNGRRKMRQPLRLATVSMMVAAGALALAACQKSAAPAANATNTAPVATNAAPANAAPAGPAPVAASGPDADSAKAFLEGLYAHYKASSSTGTTWAPMDANIKAVFDADMVKLMAADTKALKGELGE